MLALSLARPVAAQEAAGFDGFIQNGTCAAPETENPIRIDLEDSRQDIPIQPYMAKIDGSEDTVTLAYYGAPLAPGFSYASIVTDDLFSLVITDPATGESVACGDILEPDDHNFVEVGMALVQLFPLGDSGVTGYAIVQRTATERELDIITTQVRILLTTGAEAIPPTTGTPAATPVA